MELRQLKYFVRAYELQNFSEASRQLYITQSTLSQQVKQLEDELKEPLFHRIGKRVIPTEVADAFLPFARKAIYEAESGKQMIKDLGNMQTGVINIGVTYSLSNLLIKTITEFTKSYPGIRINIRFGTSSEQLSLLDNNEIDCLLSFMPEECKDEYEKIQLFSSFMYFIVHSSHPLAGLSSISQKKLSEVPLILPAQGFATRRKIDELCYKNNLKLNIKMEINDVQTIIGLIKNADAGTILTRAAVKDESELIKIPIITSDKLSSNAFLIWPKGKYRKKSAQVFSKYLFETVAKGLK